MKKKSFILSFCLLICIFLIKDLKATNDTNQSISSSTSTVSSNNYEINSSTSSSKNTDNQNKDFKERLRGSPKYSVPNINRKGQYGHGK
ncbi:hypothetical protein [Thermodesulfobacterium hveragerdense]|uniref:hypothetical protein n=1 Tax=Thermodesulfobacterium hveragerdense TaxID=53424 RepID=UPI000490F6A5|nr:hypothetical protein [Thermodesulfobacterium hveragerdense]